MPTSDSTGDPRTGRDRRVPTRVRTFKDGTIDPITEHRRPLLTWGNLILLVIMIGYGMYATGHLPQLDEFFDHLNEIGRANNNAVVGTLLTYGSYLFGAVILAVFGLFVFLFVNTRRRRLSDPKGWHKVADAPPERRQSDRRTDLPSMVMPIGKERPGRRTTDKPAAPAVAEAARTEAAQPTPVASIAAATPEPAKAVLNSAKAEAIAAAARAEAALAEAPADLPSFVMPFGKTRKPAATTPSPIELEKIIAAPAAPVTAPAVAEKPDATALAALAAVAKAEAAVAAAKVEAAVAAANAAAAKAEAAIAAAKAEAAIAQAAMAAAKAEAEALSTK